MSDDLTDLAFVRRCLDSLDTLIRAMADFRDADDVEPPPRRLAAVKAALAELRTRRDEVVRLVGGGLVRLGRIASRLGDEPADWSVGWIRSLRTTAFERDADGAAWRDLTARSHQLSTWLVILENEPPTCTPEMMISPDALRGLELIRQAFAALPHQFAIMTPPALSLEYEDAPAAPGEQAEGAGPGSQGGEDSTAARPAEDPLNENHIALLRLLADKGEPLKAGNILNTIDISDRHLRRWMGELADRGLVASTRGPSGGYTLTPAGKLAAAELNPGNP